MHSAVFLRMTLMGALIVNAFAPGVSLNSVSAAGVRTDAIDAIDAWIASVASAPAGLMLDERLGEKVVHVSGGLASVWVDYWFFAGTRFSHCGVDAFVLARANGAWRILSVADTRQRDGCRPAPGASTGSTGETNSLFGW